MSADGLAPLLISTAADTARSSAPWRSLERESFFAAIERHRRAAWRVTALCALANTALGLVVAILMSPIFYALIALALDAVNLVMPAPNLVDVFGRVLGPAFDHPDRVPIGSWPQWALIAAVPGILWMALLMKMIGRVLRASASFSAGKLAARGPDPAVLAEQRIANVIEEMAIAARLPPPRVLIAERAGQNAVVIGRDEQHATIVVSAGLLAALDREQMQGVAAHLVASIANGDMSIGARAALTLSLFGTIARLSSLLSDEDGWRKLRLMGQVLLHPSGLPARDLATRLADPFGSDTDSHGGAPGAHPEAGGERTQRPQWRAFLWAPLAGPVVITGFLGGMVSTLVLAPLLALGWRQRKYMADATAVRLTRDPDALAGALTRMGGGPSLAPWAAHLCVAESRASGSWLANSILPMIPSKARRLRALQKLGAQVVPPASHLPRAFVVIASVLYSVAGALLAFVIVLTAGLSVPLSMLLTGMPFSVLHLLLRWLGK
jgi:Zn-dependent protease with chaperone function